MTEHFDVQINATSGSAPLSVTLTGSFTADYIVTGTGRVVLNYGDGSSYEYLTTRLPLDDDYPHDYPLEYILDLATGHPEASGFLQHVYAQPGTYSLLLSYQRAQNEPIYNFERTIAVGGGVGGPMLYAINFQGSGGTGDKEPRMVIFKRGELNTQSWL